MQAAIEETQMGLDEGAICGHRSWWIRDALPIGIASDKFEDGI